jgi:hypothetical protein
VAGGGRGRGGGFSLSPYPIQYLLVHSCSRTHNIHRIQNTEYRIHNFMYIKLPMYLFFYMVLGLNDFDAGKSITRAIGRGGPENLDFSGPEMALPLLSAISGPK